MSDQTGQPTQEEIEAYYAQLREAPVEDLLMQCIGMLAAGAEAKLGRPDARTLIDAMGALVQVGDGTLGDATEQLKSAVAQLQMAQVQVERQMQSAEGGEPSEGAPEGEGSGATPAQQAPAASQPPPAQPSGPQPKPTDKLWIPGR